MPSNPPFTLLQASRPLRMNSARSLDTLYDEIASRELQQNIYIQPRADRSDRLGAPVSVMYQELRMAS